MADKTSTAISGTEVSVAAVTSAGTIAAGRVEVIFDEDQDVNEVMQLLERAKIQILDYFSNASS